MDMKDCYGHVNFTAKGNQKNSKEELFFAELRFNYNTCVTTCVLSLDGEKTIGLFWNQKPKNFISFPVISSYNNNIFYSFSGGLCESKYDNGQMGFRIDAQHCYACGRGVKHPKNGTLYETGHVADSDYYRGWCDL